MRKKVGLAQQRVVSAAYKRRLSQNTRAIQDPTLDLSKMSNIDVCVLIESVSNVTLHAGNKTIEGQDRWSSSVVELTNMSDDQFMEFFFNANKYTEYSLGRGVLKPGETSEIEIITLVDTTSPYELFVEITQGGTLVERIQVPINRHPLDFDDFGSSLRSIFDNDDHDDDEANNDADNNNADDGSDTPLHGFVMRADDGDDDRDYDTTTEDEEDNVLVRKNSKVLDTVMKCFPVSLAVVLVLCFLLF